MAATPGTRFGPYEIVKPIGTGGMGEVYEAIDTRLDRAVAVKVLPAALAADASARARFDREAKAIAALNHPNICALHDIGDTDGHGYLVMERLEGETLHQRLQRGALDIEQALEYGIALADALDAAHARGLIHRDLKPANIFITTRGIVKILDFGLAKSVQDSEADVTRSINESLTTTGTTLGTVAYMSPEQLRGESLDVRTDLFSFGLVLYEMATGERAFEGSTVVVAAAGILSQQPRAPREIRAELPVRLEQVILKALEKDRARRYQSAADLRSDLTLAKREAITGPMRTSYAAPPSTIPPPIPTRPPEALAETVRVRPDWVARKEARKAAGQAARNLSRSSRWRRLLIVLFVIFVFAKRDRWMEWVRPQAPQSSGESASETPSRARRLPPVPQPPDNVTPPGVPVRGFGFGPGLANLVTLLRAVPPETYDLEYASDDTEALAMALQIRAVLEGAGWTIASTAEIAQPAAKFGLFAPRVTSGISTLTNWAIRSGLQPEARRVTSLPRLRIVIGKQQ